MAWLDEELPVPLYQPVFLHERLRIAGGEPKRIRRTLRAAEG